MWDMIPPKFEMLKTFIGGLSTVMPSTACVESDFSLLNHVRSATRNKLGNVILEGTLHAKTIDSLRRSVIANRFQ